MAFSWTSEQIIALAPDASSAKSGKDLANLRKWVSLGGNDDALWGECQGSGSKPYQTQIELSGPTFKCSCPSRKFPCKHGLGLFLLRESQAGSFTEATPPAWVEEWLKSRSERAEKAQQKAERAATEPAKAVDAKAQAKRTESREAKVRAGLQELELWMSDLIRSGFAQAQGRPYSYWENIAARMVDAQAPGLARQLRELGSVPAQGNGWQEELLRRLARLHLIVEGYKRINELPEDTQADVRTMVGWTQREEELGSLPAVRDHWLILGRRIEEEERLRVQRTWMWGSETKRPALVLNFAHGNLPLDTTLIPGTAIDAELIFYPGSAPLRAFSKQRFGAPQPLDGNFTGSPINEAIKTYADALARNPWIEAWPLALQEVRATYENEQWKLRDAQNAELPLSTQFERGWHLLALSGGQPLSVFGEWNGQNFRPYGVCAGSRWLPL